MTDLPLKTPEDETRIVEVGQPIEVYDLAQLLVEYPELHTEPEQ